MRDDIHGGTEQKLQSEAGYIDARPQTDSSTKTSCNARPDHTFGSQTARGVLGMSVHPPSKTRHRKCARHVPYVPQELTLTPHAIRSLPNHNLRDPAGSIRLG